MKFGEETLCEYVQHYFAKYPEIAAIPVDIISLILHAAAITVMIIEIFRINKELREIDLLRDDLSSPRKASCSKSQERQR